mgnify:FL=1
MDKTQHVINNAWKHFAESTEEYYGYTMTKEQALDLYETACLDPDCDKSVDISEINSGDVLYVSEEQDSEIYQIQIR